MMKQIRVRGFFAPAVWIAALALSVALGLAAGLGSYTFIYARGAPRLAGEHRDHRGDHRGGEEREHRDVRELREEPRQERGRPLLREPVRARLNEKPSGSPAREKGARRG
jgi:hypothetical protein